MSDVIVVDKLIKNFEIGARVVKVLKDISFTITEGEFIIIVGPSGSGKSTLLHIMLGLEYPTSGTVHLLNSNIYSGTDEDQRSVFRKKHIGMVFQQANWVKSLNVLENVAFPLLLLGQDRQLALEKAFEQLKAVEMQDWAYYVPTELSGGEQQRVSLARSLIHNPEIIVADEPTGNLDYNSGETIMNLLSKLNKDYNKTVVMVTHDLEYLKFAQKAIRIFDGTVAGVYDKNNRDELLNDLHNKRISGL